ncbi:MAG TPA: hypothetical protein VNQ97_02835 [Burkholderiaceae bacterium]|nr:hypothetical protein [Burkholderiaceae bacterium]
MNKEIPYGSATSASERTTVFVPEGWSSRRLTKWFSELEKQGHSTFVLSAAAVRPILDFDEVFSAKLADMFAGVAGNEQIPSVLFSRMCSVQTAAARLLFAGQVYEAQALMRSALECGVYGCAIYTDADLRHAWVHRGDSRTARDRCRTAFAWAGLLRIVEQSSRGLRRLISPAYDKLIDLGAHPNALGIGAGVRLNTTGNGQRMIQTIFSGTHPEHMAAAAHQLVGVLHIGFELIRQTMPVRVEKAGVTAGVEEVMQSVGIQLLAAPVVNSR